MGRKNVKLAWVESDKARAISLRKRRGGSVKKVKELTILCDIMACLIIFSPNEAVPKVWPSPEMVRGLLGDFFALPEYEQKKKEMGIESFLKEKTRKIQEKLIKSHKKNEKNATHELMMQLLHGRGIHDLNLSEIYGLLSFLKDKIIFWRKKLDFMHFCPLRDPPVPPFEVQVEQLMIPAYYRSQDNDKTGKTDETTRIIHTDSLRENKSHYLIDQWFSAPDPNPNSFRPYQGSSSNGNPSLEMQPVYPQVMAFHGLIESASQPSQHHNMNNNPVMAMDQPTQATFDFMSRDLEIQEEGNRAGNNRSSNTITTNDDLRQEPPPTETSFDINKFPLDFSNDHF